MTMLLKNNINLLMHQSVQYFSLSHLYLMQTNWMVCPLESTPHIIVHVKNMMCSNLSHTLTVWPWDLLIVIANANIIGNWRRLNWISTSVGIIGIRGSNIFSPRNLPFKMMASITFFINFLMTNRVPFHNHGLFKYRSKITGDPVVSYAVECLINPMNLKTRLDN